MSSRRRWPAVDHDVRHRRAAGEVVALTVEVGAVVEQDLLVVAFARTQFARGAPGRLPLKNGDSPTPPRPSNRRSTGPSRPARGTKARRRDTSRPTTRPCTSRSSTMGLRPGGTGRRDLGRHIGTARPPPQSLAFHFSRPLWRPRHGLSAMPLAAAPDFSPPISPSVPVDRHSPRQPVDGGFTRQYRHLLS